MSGLDHHKRAGKLFALISNDLCYRLGQRFTSISRKADQDNASGLGVADVEQPAEILVLGQQYAVFVSSLFDQGAIVRTMCGFADSTNIVACCP